MSSSEGTRIAKPSWQFGLKHLLVAAAFLALLLSPVRWLGTQYLVFIIMSLGFALATIWAYHSHGYPLACGVAFACGGFAFVTALLAPVYAFHAVVNFLLTFALGWAGFRTTRFGSLLLLGVLGVYGWALSYGFERMAEIRDLQDKYPIVSLADRLEFETAYTEESEEPELAQHVRANLTSLSEDRFSWHGRSNSLERLHTRAQNEFARAAGFGFARMGSVVHSLGYEEDVEERSIPPRLPIPIRGYIETYGDYAELRNSTLSTLQQTQRNLHAISLGHFTSADNTGYVAKPKYAAGFRSHRFDGLQTELRPWEQKPAKWQLTRLELVSLLRH